MYSEKTNFLRTFSATNEEGSDIDIDEYEIIKTIKMLNQPDVVTKFPHFKLAGQKTSVNKVSANGYQRIGGGSVFYEK